MLRAYEYAPGAGLQSCAGELAAVRAAAQAGEQLTWLDLAGVDRGTHRTGLGGIAGHEATPGRLRDPFGRAVPHPRAPSAEWSASRATVTSSNGSFRPPANS